MKSITFNACTAIIALTLTALSINHRADVSVIENKCQTVKPIEPPIFSYSLAPPAPSTITKEQLHKATTIADLMPEHNLQQGLNRKVMDVRDIKIRIEKVDVDKSLYPTEEGNGNNLNQAQLDLLQSTDYASTFFLEGYTTNYKYLGDLAKERYFNYYITVVPEHQASYKDGNQALIKYLRTNCQSTIDKTQKGNLQAGMIQFTVTTSGSISDIKMNTTCGYPDVDQKMLDLINNLPHDWNVATDSNGEKIDQTLVFSYGQTGC